MHNEKKKRALLVGANGTIGKALLHRLIDDFEVVTAGLDGADITLDLSDANSTLKGIKRAGALDAVISTAGRANFISLHDISVAEFDESPYALGLKDKLMGQVNLALAAREVLCPGGSITLTSGSTSEDPILGGSSLSMVNGAIEHWTQGAATEMPKGIRINCVSPSLVEGTPKHLCKAFPGFEIISANKVALAYIRCLQSGITGKVIKI